MLLVTDFWQWYLAGSLWTPPTVCLCVSKTIRRNYLIFPGATRKKIFPVVFVKSEFLEISAVYRLARKKSFRTLWKFRVNKPYRPKRNSNGTKRGQRSFGKTDTFGRPRFASVIAHCKLLSKTRGTKVLYLLVPDSRDLIWFSYRRDTRHTLI